MVDVEIEAWCKGWEKANALSPLSLTSHLSHLSPLLKGGRKQKRNKLSLSHLSPLSSLSSLKGWEKTEAKRTALDPESPGDIGEVLMLFDDIGEVRC